MSLKEAARLGGLTTQARRTPEERSAFGRAGALAGLEKHGRARLAEMGRRGGAKLAALVAAGKAAEGEER